MCAVINFKRAIKKLSISEMNVANSNHVSETNATSLQQPTTVAGCSNSLRALSESVTQHGIENNQVESFTPCIISCLYL